VNGIAISTERLVKRYGRVTALNGLDLEVRTGEVFGFLGPNGAGKTTTIRVLLDLIDVRFGAGARPWRTPAIQRYPRYEVPGASRTPRP